MCEFLVCAAMLSDALRCDAMRCHATVATERDRMHDAKSKWNLSSRESVSTRVEINVPVHTTDDARNAIRLAMFHTLDRV